MRKFTKFNISLNRVYLTIEWYSCDEKFCCCRSAITVMVLQFVDRHSSHPLNAVHLQLYHYNDVLITR